MWQDGASLLPNEPAPDQAGMSGFWTAFVNSVAMIIVTEIGDKT